MADWQPSTTPVKVDDVCGAGPSKSRSQQPSKCLTLIEVADAPSQCATRSRADDARDAANVLRERLVSMDPALLRELVRARETAAGISQVFPEGDQRFVASDSDEEEEIEEESEGDSVDALESPRGNGLDAGSGEELDDGEACAGLLDQREDPGPRAALARAREEYGFDLLAEMRRGSLDTFARIRLANFVRSRVGAGDNADSVIRSVRKAVDEGPGMGVLADDALLKPVVPGDMLLTVLEDFDAEGDDNERIADAIRQCLEIEKLTQ